MTKDTRSSATHAGTTRDARRRVRRLERRLTAIRELEAKRRRQAAKARDRVGARDLQAKRMRQLEEARNRSAALEAELAALATAAPAEAATEPATEPAPGPVAYCLREKQKVSMVDPAPILMRNGRSGITGTCPSCGARVTRPG